jgi:hypothetical protein
MSVDARIQKLFSDIQATWRNQQYSNMRSFWLSTLDAPLYLPEERKEFITSWEQFDAYFAGNAKAMRGILVTIAPQFAVPLSATQQSVVFNLEWTTQMVNDPKPIGGWVRGLAVVEDEAGAYKLRSYIEAPLAPIMYMRELYEVVATQRSFTPTP